MIGYKTTGIAALGLLCAGCPCAQMKGSTTWTGVLSYSLVASDGGAPLIASDVIMLVATTYEADDHYLCPAAFTFTVGPSCVLKARSSEPVNTGSIEGSQSCTLSGVTFPVTGGTYSVDTRAATITLTLAAFGADVAFEGSKT